MHSERFRLPDWSPIGRLPAAKLSRIDGRDALTVGRESKVLDVPQIPRQVAIDASRDGVNQRHRAVAIGNRDLVSFGVESEMAFACLGAIVQSPWIYEQS